MGKLDFEATPGSGEAPLSVQFEDKSEAPDGALLEDYVWDFGDTQGVTGIQNPSHIYSSNGNYNVNLSAKLKA